MQAAVRQAGAQSGRVDMTGALRDAGFTGLIAFGLLLPLIGFLTGVDGSNQLILTTRWPLLLAIVAVIAACRFLYCFAITPWLARRGPTAGSSGVTRVARRYRQLVRPVRRCVSHRLSGDRLSHRRNQRRPEMDRQFRHPDPDLCDARLGAQHRGRPRRPARPRLCRVLRGRRLFLRAARQDFRAVVLDPAAARRHAVLVLGHPARLPGAAPARRLSRHRHARLRRDHPPHPDQLGGADQRLCRHHRHSAADLLRHSVQRQ